jgi:hypothetical protein
MLVNICSRYERMQCSRIKQHNCKSVIDEKHTNDHVWSFLGFLHYDMIDLPVNIVLPGSNWKRISSTGRHRGGHNCLGRAVAWIAALVGKVTSLPISIALSFTMQSVLSSLSPLHTLIPSSRVLEIVRSWNHLTLWGGIFLSNYLSGYAWERRLGFSLVFAKIPHEGLPICRGFAPRSCVIRIQPRIYL